VDELIFCKSRLEKRRNGRGNEGGQAECTCLSCYTSEIETGEKITEIDGVISKLIKEE